MMRQFSQERIDDMKKMYEERGKTITDYEANEAMNRLCDFFNLLHEIDLREKARQAEEAEAAASE